MATIGDLLQRVGGPRRALIGAVGLGITILVLVVSRAVSADPWVPAIANVPLDKASAFTQRLDDAGIPYRLERGGSDIMVAQENLARARVTLAKDGLASGARPGLELFDRQTWGWNDFTQRVNYRRALEGELERTIGHMRGVERAEVHIAITEQSAFRRADERPVTASVLIAVTQGGEPSQDIVRGIAQLVSSSVDGLSSDRVSIHDETGRLWSEPNDGTFSGLSSRQLRAQEEVEKYLQQKAEAILTQIVGDGNARVRVAASVNFDRVERTTQSVDPERQALSSETRAEIVPGAQGGAGSTNVANSYDNTKSTEVFSGAVGGVRRLTVAVLINDRLRPPASASDTTVAFITRTPEEIAHITALVRSAVGIDSTRGDAITVVSQPFETHAIVARMKDPVPTLASRVEQYQRPALSVLGILAVLVIGMLTLRSIRTMPTGTTALAAVPAPAGALPSGAQSAAPQAVAPRAAPRMSFPQADTQVRERVVKTVENDPDSAVRLMKAWIKEA